MQEKGCNGGLVDAIYAINRELKEKYHRSEKIFGFEKSEKGDNNLRFFDDNEKTVWLPQELYNHYNKYLVKNGALEKGKTIIFQNQTKFSFANICNLFLHKNR